MTASSSGSPAAEYGSATAASARRSRRARWLWLGLGHTAAALGITGAFLPLLPTTPLLLAACWAYTRGSPELRQRLLDHPRFGPSLRRWYNHGAITRRAKIAAVGALAASWVVAVWTTSHWAVPYIMAAVVLGVSGFIVTRRTADTIEAAPGEA